MKSLFCIAIILLPFLSFSKEVKVSSNIHSVTVFMQGAQLFRTATVSLNPGEQDLVFTDLSTSLDPASVRFGGKGNLTVLSVSSRINYAQIPDKDENIVAYESKIKLLQQEIEEQQLLIAVYLQEEDLLLKNKQLGGTQTGLDVNQLKMASDFLRARLTEIKKESLSIQRKIKDNQEEINKLKNQISQLNGQRGKTTKEVVVKVAVKGKTNANFTLNYFVNNAGWTPFYDIRKVGLNKPIEIDYKAKVYQTTGVAWQDVNLVLSSGNPNKNGTLPALTPWTVDYYKKNMNVRGSRNAETAYYVDGVQTSPKQDKAANGYADDLEEVESVKTSYVENTTGFEYKISLPYTVNSSNQPQDVAIQTLEIPAEFEYKANIKYDATAYLVAKLHNWHTYNLLAGSAKLFNENTFVSDIFLDVNSAEDTLVLSMGRDENIVINRVKQPDVNSVKSLGGHQKKTRFWDVSIRNNKSQNIKIIVTDQVPVSVQKDIEVKIELNEEASVDEDKGYLVWRLQLASGATKKVSYGYSVKYPKNTNTTFID